MKVVDLLRKAGAKAGLIRMLEEARKEEPATIPTKNVSLEQLLKEFDEDEKQNLVPVAAELFIDFHKVFEALRIPSYEHGWNVERVTELLTSNQFQGLDPRAAKDALLKTLHENKVPIDDIIKDAVNRDRALDSYEEFAHTKLLERSSSRQREMDDFEDQIKECQQKIVSLKAAHTEDERAFQEWLEKKVAKEEELVRTVSLLTAGHVISVGTVNNNKKPKK